ncbi:unnamed protein product [Blepharisma stoltei]|uniref:UvrD-like helicase C-terminal domain-containing protein n=1 Tax=Blepharisma stoltei TaxID=1481888 RepID=A0AAU9JNA7_9CILI|nr:unnamed protein product [Blepharisma stoltei]
MNHSQPVIKHLSVNFRSHTEILEVAHVVVQLIVTFFPDYIDRLDKETSTIHGAKPIIVNSSSINTLKLCIQRVSRRSTDIEFGWNQVVLVGNDKARKSLPRMLQEAICLTILESKGLEFDDVILYNFFNDSQAQENEWARLSKFIDSDINEIKKAREGMKSSLLCSELKHLYVGITRARKNLIIFDNDDTCRKSLQKCWMANQLIELFEFSLEIQNQVIEPQDENSDWNNLETWRRLGYQLFNRKNYGQAKFCWHKAGDEILINKIDATISAEEGKKLCSEIAAIKERAKEAGRRLGNSQKEEINRKNEKAMDLFRNAAQLFEIANEFKEAAMCYSSLEDYKNAAKLFLKINMIHEAAVAYYKAKCYKEAADLYERSRDYVMNVKCWVFADDFDRALAQFKKYIWAIQENNAKLLLQLIIRCSLSCYFPEPFVENCDDDLKWRDIDDFILFPGLKFKNYWATYKSIDEFGELSEEFFNQKRNLSANYKFDPKNTILILKHIVKILKNLATNSNGSRLYNTETIDFIEDCQKIPDFLKIFSEEFSLKFTAPLSSLLDSFVNENKRICILIANSLRLADLSCWYFLSSVFKLSKPFLTSNRFRKDAFSYFKYRSIYTGLKFIDPDFYNREILLFGLAISGFWKILWFIPENACKDLINLYFLGKKEYNKLQAKAYFTELKETKYFEQVLNFVNSDNHMTINANFDGFQLENNEDEYHWIREVHRLNTLNEEELEELKGWFRSLLIGSQSIINNDFLYEDEKVFMENCAGICFLLVGSNQLLQKIKVFLQIDEMEALIIIAEHIINFLLGKPNGIETQNRSKFLEYFLLVFGIKLISPGKSTKWLPFLTHAVMSKYYIRSEIILNKNDNSTYTFDIEGDYWLVPKTLIFKDIAKLILHCLNELVYERIKLSNLKQYPFNTTERPSAKILELRICMLGEISMLKGIKAACISCGVDYKYGNWNETYDWHVYNIKRDLCRIPFSCIFLSSASRKVLRDEAIKSLSSLNNLDKMHTIFPILIVSYLLLFLERQEYMFMDILNEVLLKKKFSSEKISSIHEIAEKIINFVSCSHTGNPKSICNSIWEILSKNLNYIPFAEASSLFQIYCAHALLACPNKLIPAILVKPYYDCYSVSIYNNLKNCIIDNQIDSILSLMDRLIELFKKILKNSQKENLGGIFLQCLTVIMNSIQSKEYFQKLKSLGFIPKDFKYEYERLNQIFHSKNINSDDLRYIYKCENKNWRISNILFDKYYIENIGENLLEMHDISPRKNINYSLFETLLRANFSLFLKHNEEVHDIYENISSGYLLLLKNRRQRETPDINIVRAIITLINNGSKIFNRIYEYSFTEEEYDDIILGQINDQMSKWILSNKKLENLQILSKRIQNKDENEEAESEDENIEYNKNEGMKMNIEDPIDKMKFNELKLKLREEIEEGFESFSMEE